VETRDFGRRAAPGVMGGDDFGRVLASARKGDGQAFAQLYESMNRRVFAFLSYRGAIDPEGMVNDVFLKVFTKLGTFDGNEIQFTAWVFKIARNTLIDESRSRSRRLDETSLPDSHGSIHAQGDVETDAFEHLSTAEVLQHLDVLTPEQRDVVVMRVVSDLTIEAIAEILGKRVGAVKAMQRRALRSLAKNFAGEVVPQ
jgi:RNA polymerase sigma-70 factor (ECF subfamily)